MILVKVNYHTTSLETMNLRIFFKSINSWIALHVIRMHAISFLVFQINHNNTGSELDKYGRTESCEWLYLAEYAIGHQNWGCHGPTVECDTNPTGNDFDPHRGWICVQFFQCWVRSGRKRNEIGAHWIEIGLDQAKSTHWYQLVRVIMM